MLVIVIISAIVIIKIAKLVLTYYIQSD
jgi:hypothetical protein